ncbi:hypothetical protein [Oleiagrimonas soli]|uniref:Sensor domain CHASE-containing protein n=1 Tax=Oleiagrimonas soli TaxID=1543381 RepID=A0A841KDG1_9GAMM|nr:hypothetical protein [Oleiagrimonas soli]MBB6183030.1 sensor domain CHASE-containing protein [Oleiagrimonas soli]
MSETLRRLKPRAARAVQARLFREASACTEALDRLRAIAVAPTLRDAAPVQAPAAQAACSD